MKRAISLLLFAVIILSMAACNSSTEPKRPLSDAHYKYGTKALEIVDNYLDFTISVSDAYKQIDDLYSSANALPTVEKDDDTYFGNSFVEHDVMMIRYELSDISSGRGSYEDLKEKRDDLAEELGLITRPHEMQSMRETTMPYEQQQEISGLIKKVFSGAESVYMFDMGEDVYDLSVYFESSDKALFADCLKALIDAAKLIETHYDFSFTNISLTFTYSSGGKELCISWNSHDGGKSGYLYDGTMEFGVKIASVEDVAKLWGTKNTTFTMPSW